MILLLKEIIVWAQQWSLELVILKEITIPRSLNDSKDERSSSAHTLLDTSNSAYGAVSYLRCTYDEECFKVSMIASKTRVTPLTPMTTLWLELLAAVLGLQLL